MMAQVRALKAHILVSNKQTDIKLEETRAERLRAELVEKGVQPSRVDLDQTDRQWRSSVAQARAGRGAIGLMGRTR